MILQCLVGAFSLTRLVTYREAYNNGKHTEVKSNSIEIKIRYSIRETGDEIEELNWTKKTKRVSKFANSEL